MKCIWEQFAAKEDFKNYLIDEERKRFFSFKRTVNKI